MSEIDLDELIEKMFPMNLLDGVKHYEDIDWIADMIYDAYAQGFKDGYSKRNPDSTLKLTFVDKRKSFIERLKGDKNVTD